MVRASSNVAQCDADAMTNGHNKPAPTQDLSSLFLELPGEIRNLIYEYALTADQHRLFYRDSIDFDSIPEAMKEEVNSLDNIWKATPQECVDAYYEHESAQGVKLCSTAESTSEFNHLKYVCKQLYKETKHLSLLDNDIVFAQDNVCAQDATHQLNRFVRQCNKSWTSKVRAVEIRPSVPSKIEHSCIGERVMTGYFDKLRDTLTEPCYKPNLLADYCTVIPAMHVRFCTLEYGMTCTIHKAAIFQRRLLSCLHGNGTCALWDNHLRIIDERCKTVAIRLSRCRSFRLSFAEGVVFDEGRIRESMNENVWVREHIVPLHDGGLEECVKGLKGTFLEEL